jgi:hypothetical protein
MTLGKIFLTASCLLFIIAYIIRGNSDFSTSTAAESVTAMELSEAVASDGTYRVVPREVVVSNGQSLSEALNISDSAANVVADKTGLKTIMVNRVSTTLIYKGDKFLLFPGSIQPADSVWVYVRKDVYN